MRKVYPRVCGGTSPPRPMPDAPGGLSPRVRGNQVLHFIDVAAGRSIPACAGEPLPMTTRSRRRRVYPRVCGGTQAHESETQKSDGLSPRVRGNHISLTSKEKPPRSIPACAGEPRRVGPRRRARPVYPRVCGGTSHDLGQQSAPKGLSPRVRGNLGPSTHAWWAGGSIPACAGEPCAGCGSRCRCRVYPRVCGGTKENPL